MENHIHPRLPSELKNVALIFLPVNNPASFTTHSLVCGSGGRLHVCLVQPIFYKEARIGSDIAHLPRDLAAMMKHIFLIKTPAQWGKLELPLPWKPSNMRQD